MGEQNYYPETEFTIFNIITNNFFRPYAEESIKGLSLDFTVESYNEIVKNIICSRN